VKLQSIRKAVIPAAGLGIRFLPITKAQPKEMLPVVDKPVIQYVVEEAILSGIEDILIITGKGKRAIEDHFDISCELDRRLRQKNDKLLMEQEESLSNMADILLFLLALSIALDAISAWAHFIDSLHWH